MKTLMAFILGGFGGWWIAHNQGWLKAVCIAVQQGVNQ
jgi:hypothetical protein